MGGGGRSYLESNPRAQGGWWRGLPRTLPDVPWPRVQLPPLLPQRPSGAPGHPPGIKKALCSPTGQAGVGGRRRWAGWRQDWGAGSSSTQPPSPRPQADLGSWIRLLPEPESLRSTQTSPATAWVCGVGTWGTSGRNPCPPRAPSRSTSSEDPCASSNIAAYRPMSAHSRHTQVCT